MYNFRGLYIEIITNCNLRCEYCYNQDNLNKYKEINMNELKSIIDFCKEYHITNITISGGEPLLHRQINYILESLYCADIDITIVSNLLLLDEQKLNCLVRNNCNIVCSIDTYSSTEKNLLKLYKTTNIPEDIKEKIVYSITINGQPMDEVRKLFHHIQSKKVKVTINNKTYSEQYIMDIVNILHEFSNKLFLIESELYTTAILNYMTSPKKYCMANKLIKIDPYLQVYPCPLATDSEDIIGKYDYDQKKWIFNENLYNVCNLKYYKQRRSDCELCEYLSLCGGCCYFNTMNHIENCYLKTAYKTLEDKKNGTYKNKAF